MDLARELFALIESFQAARIDFALCGGMAMALHGYPRFTKDFDFLIRAEDSDRVVVAAAQCGFDADCGVMLLAC